MEKSNVQGQLLTQAKKAFAPSRDWLGAWFCFFPPRTEIQKAPSASNGLAIMLVLECTVHSTAFWPWPLSSGRRGNCHGAASCWSSGSSLAASFLQQWWCVVSAVCTFCPGSSRCWCGMGVSTEAKFLCCLLPRLLCLGAFKFPLKTVSGRTGLLLLSS